MTNYTHFSGGLLCCSASLRLEDEILMHVGCLLVPVAGLRCGDCQDLLHGLHRVRFYDCGILSHTLTTKLKLNSMV
jgi:hypothetical protein